MRVGKLGQFHAGGFEVQALQQAFQVIGLNGVLAQCVLRSAQLIGLKALLLHSLHQAVHLLRGQGAVAARRRTGVVGRIVIVVMTAVAIIVVVVVIIRIMAVAVPIGWVAIVAVAALSAVGRGLVVAAAAIAVIGIVVVVGTGAAQGHSIHLPQIEGPSRPGYQHEGCFEAGLQPHTSSEPHGSTVRRWQREIGPVLAGYQLVDVHLPGHTPRKRPAIEHQAKRHAALRSEIYIGGGRVCQRGSSGRKQAGQGKK